MLLRELRILSRLRYYDDLLELTLNEIYYDEKEKYTNDEENLRMTIADWFYNYISGRIFKQNYKEKIIYLFLDSSEDLCMEEFEELMEKTKNKLDFSSEEKFGKTIEEIFKAYNYNPDEDYFDNFDDEYMEEE